MKDFNIYLKERLNEYSFLIGNRLHECDVVVEALTMRDGITITDYILLESCLEQCRLMKFCAAELDAELSAHIDRTLGRCHALLQAHSEFAASVKETVAMPTGAEPLYTVFGVSDIPLCAEVFAKIDSSTILGADPILMRVTKNLGEYNNAVISDQDIFKMTKLAAIRGSLEVEQDSTIQKMTATEFSSFTDPVILAPEPVSLFYKLIFKTSSDLTFDASIRDAILSNGLGKQDNRTIFDEELDFAAESLVKAMRAECAIYAAAAVDFSARTYASAIATDINFGASASAALLRFRHVAEIDDSSLSASDASTLYELDYITLAD